MTTLELSAEVAEASLLAAILDHPSALPDVRDLITLDAFGTLTHRDIYAAMLRCDERGAAPDLANVREALLAQGRDEAIMPLFSLVGEGVLPLYVTDYARRVLHHARRRTVLNAVTRIAADVHQQPDADPVEIAHAALAKLDELTVDEGGPVLYADVIERFQERLLLQLAGEWEPVVVPTRLRVLDHKLSGGFRPGDLVIVPARPAMGKTAFSLQLMHNIARPPKPQPVLFFSAEMSLDSLIERGVSEMAGIPLEQVRQRQLDKPTYEMLHRATELMAPMPVAIDDTSAVQTRQMLVRAQRFKRQHGLAGIFFDYMELAGDNQNESEQLRLTHISHGLKHIAKTLGVPVVALSQLSRKVEERTPPIPRMSDIRMSGAIEADADIILMLYRHDYYAQQNMVPFDPAKEGITDIYIGKHRNGEQGMVSVRFDAPTMRFLDLDEPVTAQPLMKVS